MAETRIFLTDEDFLQLSAFVMLNFSATFIPRTNHGEPEEIRLNSVEDIRLHLEKFRSKKSGGLGYFITSPSWSIEPIYFERIDSTSGLGTFYAAINKFGGPYIELIPRFGFPKTIAGKIVVGHISDYPYYISGSFLTDKVNGYKTIDRPNSIISAVREIKAFIKKNGSQVASTTKPTRKAYAMKGAIELLYQGVILAEGECSYAKK